MNSSVMSDCSRAWVEVDLGAVAANARVLVRALAPERALMAVVKADGYGHGALPAAAAATCGGAAWVGIAATAEGAALRRGGISAPIALLCPPAPNEIESIAEYGLTAMVGDPALATALARHSPAPDVHLEIDTGMGRSGIMPERAVDLWRHCMRLGLSVSGLCTHFADADGEDAAFTGLQWARFAAARRALEDEGARFTWVHASNSAAALRYGATACNLARPGLLLYGILPAMLAADHASERGGDDRYPLGNGAAALRPALALKARVATVRHLPAGSTISYGATYRLRRTSRVATVLIGYGDGYPRRLSNCGEMVLHGCRAPILGRVCMDQTVIDVTDIPRAAAGDVAACIGVDGTVQVTAEAIARLLETTEHEVTTCLTARLPRLYLDARGASQG